MIRENRQIPSHFSAWPSFMNAFGGGKVGEEEEGGRVGGGWRKGSREGRMKEWSQMEREEKERGGGRGNLR